MSYSSKYDIFFIHVPKNAGTMIINTFGFNKHGHIRFIDVENKLTDKKSFAVVRNPYDRIVSIYEYCKMEKSYWHSNDNTTPYKLIPAQKFLKNMSFKEFVIMLKNNPNKLINNGMHYHLKSQFFYVKNKHNTIGVKTICKFENINNDLEQLFGQDMPILSRINNSRNTNNWEKYYDDELKDIIYKMYKEDFVRFGYEK